MRMPADAYVSGYVCHRTQGPGQEDLTRLWVFQHSIEKSLLLAMKSPLSRGLYGKVNVNLSVTVKSIMMPDGRQLLRRS